MKNSLKDWFHIHILPVFAWIFFHIMTFSFKLRFIGRENIKQIREKNDNIIFAAWHGRQFLLIPCLPKEHLCAMSSTSRDGMMQANILKKFHFSIIPGSSKKSPARALIGNIRKIQSGFDTVIAVDGPTGPLYKVKPGAVFMSKKTGAPIIPVVFSSSPGIELKSWDRYLLPFPFAKCVMIFGNPIYPNTDLSESAIQEESEILENTLNHLMKEADQVVEFNKKSLC